MKLFCLLALAILIAIGAWERTSIAGLRAGNAALRDQHAAAQAVLDENSALTKQWDEAPTAPAGGSKSELLRLRNDVRRLRSGQGDPAQLRAENEKLAADLKSGNIHPPRLADLPRFLAREDWNDAGHATPEAALQSACHAMRQGNIDLLIESMSPPEALSMRRELEKDPVKVRADFAREAREHFTPTGYVIAGREELEGGVVRLQVKFALQNAPTEMEFQRVGNSWRMSKGF